MMYSVRVSRDKEEEIVYESKKKEDDEVCKK